MKQTRKMMYLLTAVVMLALAACGGKGATPTPTTDAGPVFTQLAMTAIYMQTETAQAIPPTETATNTPDAATTPEPTNTPLITDTPGAGTPSATQAAVNTPQATARPTTQASCDNVDPNITDVTIPDNTEVPAGASFVKTWGIKNLGPCTWDEDYTLIFSYDSANGATGWSKVPTVHFPDQVKPGETMNISIDLPAPDEPGTYRGVYRLQNSKGFNFGPEFWVQVVVK